MKLQIKYSETMKQVIALIIIPLAMMAIAMFALFSINLDQFSETVETVVIFAFIIAAIGISVFIVLKIIAINATLEYDNRFVNIHLENKSFLYPNQEFHFNYSNIENAAYNVDASARVFILIKLRKPNKSMSLSPINAEQTAEFETFWNGFSDQINSYNSSNTDHPEMKIKSVGFYEGKWAKILAIISLLLALVFTIFKIISPDVISTWRLIAFYCYLIPFASAVYLASKKNKE